jgi:hypothetical protein
MRASARNFVIWSLPILVGDGLAGTDPQAGLEIVD